MSTAKKKLLVLTPRFPYPVIGGDKLRVYHLCRVLSRHYSLTLLSLCETPEEMCAALPDDGVFDRVERVFLPRWRSYVNTLLALPTRTPLQVAYYRSRAFAAAVSWLLPLHDGVFVHLVRCAEYVRKSDKPRVLEMTDAISLNYSRVKQLRHARGLKSRVFGIEAKRLLDYERMIVDDFDLSVLVSKTDRDYLFPGESARKVMVCSNGVDLSGLPYVARSMASRLLIFIGDMRTVQNQDMCRFFAEEVLPLLRKRAGYRFRIVGSIAPVLAERFRAYEGVEVTGRVASVAEAASDGAIGVCPMRIGAGVQNKILEYMALGLPVVTTSLGHEGLGAKSGQDLLIADTPEEFVRRIEGLVFDEAFAAEMAARARTFVEREHGWERMLAPLVERVGALVV
ncbi:MULTISPECIES: glycosyltransferase [Burkholderia]|uniref:Glycosyltransferase n=2 Tax=Burkholderia contaminans TaxID=488447 RepID=A0A1E3FMA3_9BURK|nr:MULTISPECIES: glycosyltransferase [Burkholderia]UTP21417.1 glycosyltransferase family 4 protein [Burkholderia sp. FXe9]KKL39873.1 glycosyl transferase family 1 [Burkholderia contaminans LMG 23361]MBA9828201.1 glycosyltransferase [Burkholderia contaminans]MBA9836750.1 glycosyltransferase [Burkholderia contaminans]MBA9865045.1 glycosyltransferase [Burkholderia contaminans]